jgi:hypothetical protein
MGYTAKAAPRVYPCIASIRCPRLKDLTLESTPAKLYRLEL